MKPQRKYSKFNIIVAVFILLAGILVGGYLVLKSKTGTASIGEQLSKIFESNKKPVADCQPNAADQNKDSDNDGLKDWEEATWKTDPCRPDTDGDGYLDGEEVASGYDPAKPAPLDVLSGQEQIAPRSLPQNLTQALGTILAEKITSGQLSPLADEGTAAILSEGESSPLSENAINEAIEQLSPNFNQFFVPPQINLRELNLISETNKATIEAYAKELARVLNENPWLTDSEKTDAQIISEAIGQGKYEETDTASQVYLARFRALKKVAVPSELISIHQGLLEKFFIISQFYQSIRESSTDPLKVMVGLQRYQQIIEEIKQLMSEYSQISQAHPE